MNIKFKIPAIAVDDDGNEQAIELSVISRVPFSESRGNVFGTFSFKNLEATFEFVAEHPFTAWQVRNHE